MHEVAMLELSMGQGGITGHLNAVLATLQRSQVDMILSAPNATSKDEKCLAEHAKISTYQ